MSKLEKIIEALVDKRIEEKLKELTLGYEYSSTCPGEDDMDVILYSGATVLSSITLS